MQSILGTFFCYFSDFGTLENTLLTTKQLENALVNFLCISTFINELTFTSNGLKITN